MSSVALHRGPAGCENSRHALKQRRCAYYERVITRRSRVSIFKAGPHTHTRIIINTMCVYGGSHRGKKAFGIQTTARTRQIYFIKKINKPFRTRGLVDVAHTGIGVLYRRCCKNLFLFLFSCRFSPGVRVDR